MSESSISKSFSKDSVYESLGLSVTDVALAEALRNEGDSISNESICKGDELLDTYEVISDAIKGGMGSVWRVHHRGWNVDLAMKRPLPKLFAEGSRQRKENFIRECESWIDLGLHPNIVSCYYVREIGGVPTIFSEWMDNGSLGDRIRDGSLYEGTETDVQERLLSIAIQSAFGLAYAHQRGLVHQDVKPDNLLLSGNMDVKVADFGLARARGLASDGLTQKTGKTQMAPTGGYTPAYCSPEQALNKELTRRTDLYSWALTLLEMYCGGRMWENGAEAYSSLQRYLKKTRIPMQEELRTLLAACLSCEPESRPHDFAEITDPLCSLYHQLTGIDFPCPDAEQIQETAGAFNNQALSFYDLGKPEKTEKLLEAALLASTAHQDALFNRALIRLRSGEIDLYEAKQQLEPIKDRKQINALCTELDKENSGTLELVLNTGRLPLPDGVIDRTADGSRILTAEKTTNEKIMDLFRKDRSAGIKGEQTRYCVRAGSDGRLLFQHTAGKKIGVRLSADGRTVIFLSNQYTEAFSVDTGKRIFRYEERCTASPDGRYIVGYQPKTADDWNGLINTKNQRRPFIFRLENGTEKRFAARMDLVAFSEDGRILFRDDNSCYSLHDPESEEKWGQSLFMGELLKSSVHVIGGQRGARFILERGSLYDLTALRKLLRLPVRFSDTVCAISINEGRYVLTFSHVRKKHYETEQGSSYLTVAVWETATGRLVHETQADLLCKDGRKTNFLVYLDHQDLNDLVAGGMYTAGSKADFRLAGIESINERILAAKTYQHFMQEARAAGKQGNTALALKTLRCALSVNGYANSEEALTLRETYGKTQEKTGIFRFVPTRTLAPEIAEKPRRGPYGSRATGMIRQKIQEQIAAFEKNFPEDGRENYSAQCWEAGVQYSGNGAYFTVLVVTNEHYYDMSPEVNDPDPENTAYRGFLLFCTDNEELVYEKAIFMRDPEDDSPTTVTRKNYDAQFRALPDDRGDRVLVIDLDDNLFLQRCDCSTPEMLVQGDCVSAEFFDNDRFILVLHRNGDVEIFGGEDRTVSYGKIHLENCDRVFSVDGGRLGYTAYGTSAICIIDWDYAVEKNDV